MLCGIGKYYLKKILIASCCLSVFIHIQIQSSTNENCSIKSVAAKIEHQLASLFENVSKQDLDT